MAETIVAHPPRAVQAALAAVRRGGSASSNGCEQELADPLRAAPITGKRVPRSGRNVRPAGPVP